MEFLKGSKGVFRQRLQSPDNLDWLLTLATWGFRDRWLKILPPASPSFGSFDGPVRGVGLVLSRAVIKRLRRQYPKEAKRADSTLVRYYPDQAAALLNQALGHLDDTLTEDLVRYPTEPLDFRTPRVLPKLMTLPSRKGRSARSNVSALSYLAAYETVFEKLPQRRESVHFQDLYYRDEIERVFGPVSDTDAKRLCRMTRSRLALEYASRTVPPTLSPARIRNLLPRARQLARAIDLALSHPSQRQ